MAETGFWVNPFQILRLNSKDEMQKAVEYTSKEAGGDDGCCENGDKSIFRNFSPTPGSQTKAIPVPTRNSNACGYSYTSTSDPASPKDAMNTYYTPDKIAELLAQMATTPSKDTSYLKMFENSQAAKYIADEPKSPKKHLKRSVSFNNHLSRPISPRQTTSQSSYIDVAEVLATTVSLVRENNRKLDKWIEVKSEGSFSENDNEYSCDEPEDEQGLSAEEWKEIKAQFDSQIQDLEFRLQNMGDKYSEQLNGMTMLVDELKVTLRKSEKDLKRKCAEIARLEEQLETSRHAISELVEQQQRDDANESQSSEELRHLETELREKNRAIAELNKRITVSSRQVSDSKEKEKRLEALMSQVARYQSLEAEWNAKQTAFDGLSSQLEKLRLCEAELSEKTALIESLNIRLETSQQVIAELREKHAPHDLLRQLRQKDYIIDNLTQQVENFDADLKDKDDEIEALARKLAEDAKLMEKLREQNSQLVPLRKRAEEADLKSVQIQQQLAQKERLLTDLEHKYRESSRTTEDGAEKLRAQEKTISVLRQEVMELRRELTTQASQNREKERLLINTREETAHIRANFQGLLNALTEKDQKIQQLDQHIESLQHQAAAAAVKSQAGGTKDQKSKNEVRFNALQKVLNTKIEACREYEKKISQLEADFSNLKKTMDDGKTVSSEKEIKIQRLVKMNRELKEEVTQLKENIEAKEKELIVIKSRIPHPTPGSAPAASIRTPSKSVRSRVSSMYSGGESSSDETGRHVKAASIHGYPSPLRRTGVTSSTMASRRLSDASKTSSSTIPRGSLTRTRSTISTSSEDIAFRKKAALTQLAAKREVKPRKPTTPSTVEVLKKKSPSTTKDASPINRLAVTQRRRDMGVINNMLSGVASDRKNKVSTLAQRRSTTVGSSTSTKLGDKNSLTYNTASSDSETERKTTLRKSSSDLTTIMEKIKKNNGSTVKPTTSTTSTSKPRTSLTRPLPSKKPSSTV